MARDRGGGYRSDDRGENLAWRWKVGGGACGWGGGGQQQHGNGGGAPRQRRRSTTWRSGGGRACSTRGAPPLDRGLGPTTDVAWGPFGLVLARGRFSSGAGAAAATETDAAAAATAQPREELQPPPLPAHRPAIASDSETEGGRKGATGLKHPGTRNFPSGHGHLCDRKLI